MGEDPQINKILRLQHLLVSGMGFALIVKYPLDPDEVTVLTAALYFPLDLHASRGLAKVNVAWSCT
jgi:hypothetical protein